MTKKITIFRIEHKETKLGPFQHACQIPEVIHKGIKAYHPIIEDIDNKPNVKELLQKYPHAKFGFISYEHCLNFIKDINILTSHGFHIATDWVIPLYINDCDGQVLFISSRDES